MYNKIVRQWPFPEIGKPVFFGYILCVEITRGSTNWTPNTSWVAHVTFNKRGALKTYELPDCLSLGIELLTIHLDQIKAMHLDGASAITEAVNITFNANNTFTIQTCTGEE